ncbi:MULTISPECIES: DUF6461 domain-containing protein [unclassified Streptomyces]|uniref:DUF6461 domain-containing protein n=1 Tax=unclassified Streptomyces TaxID=2593676 RepID=UPI00403D1D1A
MADGIAWFLEPYLIDCVTFARDVEPVELASRLGARPGQPPHCASADDAVDLLAGDGVGSVARVGRAGDWSFAVEYGDAVGPTTTGLGAVSAKGVEAVSFLLTPWHPPSMFTYYRDGNHICSFGIGEEARRRGQKPDVLVPALTEVGVLPAQQNLSEADAERVRRLSVLTIEEHFRLRLPRTDVLHGQLPLFVVRKA